VLDVTARRYGQRPSTLMDISDPWEALMVDAVCADAGRAWQEAATRRIQQRAGKGMIPVPLPVSIVGGL
jgi:hypothetical protein